MEATESSLLIPELPEEAEYPAALTHDYELMECLSEKENVRTLLAVKRGSGDACVVKCYLKDSPLFDCSEPVTLRELRAAPMPRFLAEYRNAQMRCVLREYVPGETLSQLAKNHVFKEDEVIRIGVQLCEQLHALHTMEPPVIHRDIKPQNVVLRPDGTAVLIDFGIARIHTEKETDTVAFGTQGFARRSNTVFPRQMPDRISILSVSCFIGCCAARQRSHKTAVPHWKRSLHAAHCLIRPIAFKMWRR